MTVIVKYKCFLDKLDVVINLKSCYTCTPSLYLRWTFLWTNLWNIIAKSEPKCWSSVMWNVWSGVYKPLSDHSKSIDPRMLSEKNELTREVERFGINMNTI